MPYRPRQIVQDLVDGSSIDGVCAKTRLASGPITGLSKYGFDDEDTAVDTLVERESFLALRRLLWSKLRTQRGHKGFRSLSATGDAYLQCIMTVDDFLGMKRWADGSVRGFNYLGRMLIDIRVEVMKRVTDTHQAIEAGATDADTLTSL